MKKMTKQQLVLSVCGIFVLFLLGVFFFFSQKSRSLEKFCDATSKEKKAGSFLPGTSPQVLHKAFIEIDRVAPADIHESTSHIRESYERMLDKPEDKTSLEFGMTGAQARVNEYIMTRCKT